MALPRSASSAAHLLGGLEQLDRQGVLGGGEAQPAAGEVGQAVLLGAGGVGAVAGGARRLGGEAGLQVLLETRNPRHGFSPLLRFALRCPGASGTPARQGRRGNSMEVGGVVQPGAPRPAPEAAGETLPSPCRSAFRGCRLRRPPPILRERTRRRFLILARGSASVLLTVGVGARPLPERLRPRPAGAGAAWLLLLWLLWRAYQAFLYKVGRRLAFSYFLLGVLPIPLLLLLLAVLAYLLSGFFLGHLYRDAVQSVQQDSTRRRGAPRRLRRRRPAPPRPRTGAVVFGYYRRAARARRRPADARRLAGLDWSAGPSPPGPPRAPPASSRPPAAAATLAAAASRERHRRGGPLHAATSTASSAGGADVWTETLPLGRSRPRHHQPGDPRPQGPPPAPAQGPAGRRGGEVLPRLSRASGSGMPPSSGGGRSRGPLFDLWSGRTAADYVAANLNGTPRTVPPPLRQRRRDRRLRLGHPAGGGLPAVRRLRRRGADGGVHDRRPVAGGEPDEPRHRGGAPGRLRRPHPGAAARPGGGPPALVQRDGGRPGGAGGHRGPEGARWRRSWSSPATSRRACCRAICRRASGVEFATLFEPSAAIGGDYFDVLRRLRGRAGGDHRRRLRPRAVERPAHGDAQGGAADPDRGDARARGDPPPPRRRGALQRRDAASSSPPPSASSTCAPARCG